MVNTGAHLQRCRSSRPLPTSYKDQFYVLDPANPPNEDDPVTVERYEFTDVNDDGEITSTSEDQIEGNNITNVWVGDWVTINVPGIGDVTYVGVTFYVDGGPTVFTPTDGQILQDGTFVTSDFVTTATETPVTSFGPTCFTPGTLIDTVRGRVPVEDLRTGDLIQTRDNGLQPLRHVLKGRFVGVGPNAPVRIAAGALGNTEPMRLSQQHRVLIRDPRADFWFGHDEVLTAIVHLTNGDSIRVEPCDWVTYLHLVFDRHEIVTAAGLAVESYNVARSKKPKPRRCGFDPHVADLILDRTGPPEAAARPILLRHEARLFAGSDTALPICA